MGSSMCFILLLVSRKLIATPSHLEMASISTQHRGKRPGLVDHECTPPTLSLNMSVDDDGRLSEGVAKCIHSLGVDDALHDACFVFKRDKDHSLGCGGALAHDDATGDTHQAPCKRLQAFH